MSDEGYTDEALLHDGDESAGAIADDGDNNGADDASGGAANTSGGDDPELEAIKARVKQGGKGHSIGLMLILSLEFLWANLLDRFLPNSIQLNSFYEIYFAKPFDWIVIFWFF